jgi:hypothetical protein
LLFAVLLISVNLLFADAHFTSAVFLDGIGDTFSLWIFYALSQQYLHQSLYTDPTVSVERGTTQACCARFPYVPPYDCFCEPLPSNSVQHSESSVVLVAFVTLLLIHRWTSLIRKQNLPNPDQHDIVLKSGILLFLAPAAATLGLPQWLVSWTNWIICHCTALLGGFIILLRTLRDLVLHIKHYDRVDVYLQSREVTLDTALWCFLRFPVGMSWLFMCFMSTLNYFYSSKKNAGVLFNSSLFANLFSVTSSPFAFIGMCVFCGQLYFFTVHLFACFISMKAELPGAFNPNSHTVIFWLAFGEGINYYIFGIPIFLSLPHIFVILLLPTVLVMTQLLVSVANLAVSFWFRARTFLVYLILLVIPLCETYACIKLYGLFGSPVICALTSTTFCIEIMGLAITNIVYAVDGMRIARPWDTIMDATRFIQVSMFDHDKITRNGI